MFYADDYPSWVDNMFESLDLSDSDLEEDCWALISSEEGVPNLGNVQVEWLFNKIIAYAAELSPGISSSTYINNMDSHLTLDGESITDSDTFLRVCIERRKRIAEEAEDDD